MDMHCTTASSRGFAPVYVMRHLVAHEILLVSCQKQFILSCDCTKGFYGQMWQLFSDTGLLLVHHINYLLRFVLANLLPMKHS